MIRHIVLCDLQLSQSGAALQAIMAGIAALQARLPGFIGFACGVNRDVEGLLPRHGFGFTCDFADAAALRAYLADPAHQALGARLEALCNGGRAGLIVADLELAGA